MSEKTGGCLCGAVRFVARDVPTTYGACHCEMCRRWTGSALLSVPVPAGSLSWLGGEHIAERQTTPWAKRGWCRDCGSALFFMVTQDGEWSGKIDVPIGLFDDPDGFTMTNEIYIDHKPDSYAYAGTGRKLLTRAECIEKFPVLSGGDD